MLVSTPLVLIYAARCLRGAADRSLVVTALVIAVAEAVLVGTKVVEIFSW